MASTQAVIDASAQPRHPKWRKTSWVKGVSGNPRGAHRVRENRIARDARIAETLKELKTVYQYDPLLHAAAAALDNSVQAYSLRKRMAAANAAQRILSTVPRKPPPPPRTLAELKAEYEAKQKADKP